MCCMQVTRAAVVGDCTLVCAWSPEVGAPGLEHVQGAGCGECASRAGTPTQGSDRHDLRAALAWITCRL
mgnify:CR=1 FL=1